MGPKMKLLHSNNCITKISVTEKEFTNDKTTQHNSYYNLEYFSYEFVFIL